MNNLYLDTNFFIYLSDTSSPFHLPCLRLVRYCNKNKILTSTSTETIQEIIHLAKNTKQLDKGLLVSQKTLQLVHELLPVGKATIGIYLKKAGVHRAAKSRDLIHLAVCLENKIEKIVTYDKEFRTFAGIKALQPQEITSV